MSFWKFSFSPPTTSIDSLLNALPQDSTSIPPTSPALSSVSEPASPSYASPNEPGSPSKSSSAEVYHRTLDSLLATSDLLSEIKSATNPKLNDFLAREEAVCRLAGWIVWGLGGEGLIDQEIRPLNGDEKKLSNGIECGVTQTSTVGNVIRRRDMDAQGVLAGGPETVEEKSWAG